MKIFIKLLFCKQCIVSLVDGNWGAWSSFGACSQTCGPGTQTHSRICDSPGPLYGGLYCQGSATESQSCKVQDCQVLLDIATQSFGAETISLSCNPGYSLLSCGLENTQSKLTFYFDLLYLLTVIPFVLVVV